MIRPLGCRLCLIVFSWTSAVLAAPVAGAELSVDRSATAGDCPDDYALAQRVLRHVTRASQGPLRIVVSIDRNDDLYTAEIKVSGEREGVRKLGTQAADCTALSEALTVAIALLLDPDATFPSASDPAEAGDFAQQGALPAPPTEPARVPPARPLPDVVDPEDDAVAPPAVSLVLGPTFAVGVMPGIGPGLNGGVLVAGSGWSAELGAGWFAPRSVRFEPGEVEVQLTSLTGAVCATHGFAPDWFASGCALFTAGLLTGAGRNFDEFSSETPPLWTSGLGGRLIGPLVGPLAWMLRVDGLLPLRKESFSVRLPDGENRRVWATGSVGAWFAVDVVLQIW